MRQHPVLLMIGVSYTNTNIKNRIWLKRAGYFTIGTSTFFLTNTLLIDVWEVYAIAPLEALVSYVGIAAPIFWMINFEKEIQSLDLTSDDLIDS